MHLTPDGYRPRLIEKEIQSSLCSFGAVCIEGPKYRGKTWAGLYCSESAFMMGDSNEYGISNKELAETNIMMAIAGEMPPLIDEWQEIPRIWDVVKSEIDRRSEKGMFILTGSSAPQRIDAMPLHSGAGRIDRLRMRTMSLYESGESTGSVSLFIYCLATTSE